jgi:hypothetical protein
MTNETLPFFPNCRPSEFFTFERDYEAICFVPPKVLEVDYGMGKHNWKCLWFVSIILESYYRDGSYNDWQEISYLRFVRFLNVKFYMAAKKALLDAGVIEVDNSYCVHAGSASSKKFRICEKFRGGQVRIAVRNKPLSKKIRKIRIDKIADVKGSKGHAHVTRCVYDTEFDIKAAQEFIKAHPPESDYRHTFYMRTLDTIYRQAHWFSVDPRTGRFCHSIANCMRDYRKFIKYQGEQLVEVDVSCSQPFLASSFYGVTDAAKAERGKYLEWVGNDFYGRVAALGELESRDKAKTKTFIYIFFDRTRPEAKFWIKFSAEFPVLAEALIQRRKCAYNAIALDLQGLEAKIMVEGVCAKLGAKNIFGISIHDGILCRVQDKDRIAEMIKQEFLDVLGHEPKIKFKNFEQGSK